MNLNRGDGGLMLSTPRRGVQKLVLINPSQITACAAKVVIVMDKVKLVNSNINVTKITLYVKVTVTMIIDTYRRCKTWSRS